MGLIDAFVGETESEKKRNADAITYGYDRHVRSWCVIVVDAEGNEIQSDYLATKEGCMKWIEYMKAEYGISKTKKYKAY